MKKKTLNLLKNVCFSKYLIIAPIIVLTTSCEKEISSSNQTFSFQNYFYPDNIGCYDTNRNRLDSLSYMYSQSDFIYTDEYIIPYKEIEIYADSTVILYYAADEVINSINGIVTRKNDTLYFYYKNSGFDDLLFKGLIIDNQLKIPGYGYIYYTFISNGAANVTSTTKINTLGIPYLENLLEEFPDGPHINSEILRIQTLYIQKFDLIYELNDE